MDLQKRMKIGFFIDAFFPMIDGVIMVVDQYAKHLSEIADVYVFAPRSEDKTYQDPSYYHVLRSRHLHIPFTDYDLSLPLLDFSFRKQLNAIDLDIVHIHSPFTMGKMGITYAKKRGIPIIGTLHSQYQKDLYERTKSKVLTELAVKEIINTFNRCDELWAVNQAISNLYYSYGTNRLPLVMENATDLIPLSDIKASNLLKLNYQIKPLEKVLLYVGRLDAVKNLDFLMLSLYTLRLKGFSFKMIFIGSGPHEETLKKSTKKFGLNDYVLFLGKITDRQKMASHFAMADLFLFPSIYDSSSLVQIEAASQKTPTLFIDGTATSSMITDKVNGYLSKQDPKVYAETIIQIFKLPKLHQKVKEAAFHDLYKTWDVVSKHAYQRYQTMIKKELD
jgi:glycosyltransferase involved in cell wall biosynthesis